jgi:hypothetical protein
VIDPNLESLIPSTSPDTKQSKKNKELMLKLSETKKKATLDQPKTQNKDAVNKGFGSSAKKASNTASAE